MFFCSELSYRSKSTEKLSPLKDKSKYFGLIIFFVSVGEGLAEKSN
jgi:Kef-type K+ transport system membrane component KefB